MTTRTEKIAAIRSLPTELQEVIEGLTESELNSSYREGGWTAKQIVHHLADSHMNAFIRMKLIVAEDHPTLKPYEQDDWARTADAVMPLAPSLSILSGLQERMAVLLESLPDEAFTRTAHHPENGEMTLDSILTTYANHGRNHIKQIKSIGSEQVAA
jgi:hypothetical protein